MVRAQRTRRKPCAPRRWRRRRQRSTSRSTTSPAGAPARRRASTRPRACPWARRLRPLQPPPRASSARLWQPVPASVSCWRSWSGWCSTGSDWSTRPTTARGPPRGHPALRHQRQDRRAARPHLRLRQRRPPLPRVRRPLHKAGLHRAPPRALPRPLPRGQDEVLAWTPRPTPRSKRPSASWPASPPRVRARPRLRSGARRAPHAEHPALSAVSSRPRVLRPEDRPMGRWSDVPVRPGALGSS